MSPGLISPAYVTSRAISHILHSGTTIMTYSNKRIAVIGNGSSGTQIVPQMARLPGTVVQDFVRGPTWVYYRAPPSKHLGRDDPDPNPKYTDEERERFNDPEYHLQHRKGIISRTNKSFGIFLRGEKNEEGMRLASEQMAEKLRHDKRLCDILIPKWELGCRRITPGPGYLESFSLPNCDNTNSPITKIANHGVHTADGSFFECDVGELLEPILIVLLKYRFDHQLTVFHSRLCHWFRRVSSATVPRGRQVWGRSCYTRWAEDPDSYLSVAVPDYPN